jgi:dihydroorotase
MSPREQQYDLLLKGGQVIDPAQGVEGTYDVAFSAGRVARLEKDISKSQAKEVYDAAGKIITPGLVDLHTHFYYGVHELCRDPRKDFLPCGVTCALEAGTSGAANYYNLRDFIIKPSELHLYAFVNIAAGGLLGVPWLKGRPVAGARVRFLDMALVEDAVKLIEENPDTIVGTKAILHGAEGTTDDDLVLLLKRAVQAARETNTRVLVHVHGGPPLKAVLDQLEPNDIVSHCFHKDQHNVLDDNGKVRPEVREAIQKGILFDIAPAGYMHFAWSIAEAAAEQGVFPTVIASDYVYWRAGEPMYTLPEVMSFMWNLGMPLNKVFEAATVTPAKAVGKGDRHGSLKQGVDGDAAVFRIEEGDFEYLCMGETRRINRRLSPVLTVLGGNIWKEATER